MLGWVEKRDSMDQFKKQDPVDKFLDLNPGNTIRQKAIGVDLSDFEQLK